MSLNITAAHVVNRYFWNHLVDQGVMNPADYPNSTVPFFPSRQPPGMVDLTNAPPFVVYAFSEPTIAQGWWEKEQTIAYDLYSKDIDTSVQFNTLAQHLFSDYDDGAARINAYKSQFPEFDPFHFKYTMFTSGNSAGAPTSEDGRFETITAVTVRYTRDLLF